MAQAKRDENSVPTLLGVSNVDSKTPVVVFADPVTHRLLVDSGGSGGSGITSINTDVTAAQTLTVGTTGTDFAIVDNGTGDHKFNLPTASHTNRGALSSADWDTFNAKGTGTVTTVSVTTANGVSGTVATATTTPAITLALGAITPSSVAATGTVGGSNLSGNNTGDQTITLQGAVTGTGTGTFTTTMNSPLSSLTDTVIATPTVNQILTYNGTNWINGPGTVASASQGISFFNDDTNIIPISANNTLEINTLSKTPITTAEVADPISVTAGTSPVPGEAYLYNTALGRTVIDSGVWTFITYAGVNSVAAGRVSSMNRNIYRVMTGAGTVATTGAGASRTATVTGGTPFLAGDANASNILASYLQTPQGLYQITGFTSTSVVTIATPAAYANETGVAYSDWRFLFATNTGTITGISPAYQTFTVQSVQPAFTVAIADKLGSIVYGLSNNTTTVTFVHNGTTHYSHFDTPLITLHNNLAGLQGGTSNEYYHLTSAEYANKVLNAGTSTDNAIARFDSTTGKIVQDSSVIVSDIASNAVTINPPATAGTSTDIKLVASTGGTTNDGGASSLIGGAGGATSGAGGYVVIQGGAGTNGNGAGGTIYLLPGQGNGSGANGKIQLAKYGGQTGLDLDLSLIASSEKTFTFPNLSGVGLLNHPRVLSATNYTTDTGTSINCDNQEWFIVTAQAGALKFNNPAGTPTDGQALKIAVTGTAARALTWDTSYEASTVALPTTTATTARLNIGFVWRADTSKWVCCAVA